jgi:hypothetical protein
MGRPKKLRNAVLRKDHTTESTAKEFPEPEGSGRGVMEKKTSFSLLRLHEKQESIKKTPPPYR